MYLYTVIFENVKMVSQAYSTVQFSPYAFESLNKIILRLHCIVPKVLFTGTGSLYIRLDVKWKLMCNDRIPQEPHLYSAPAPDVEFL